MKTLFHTDHSRTEAPYKSFASEDLDELIDRIGDAHYVLLGEASHGTHEFYTWRTEISKRLIAEKGFSLIAVEGDWPDCYKINRYIKGYKDAHTRANDVLQQFNRWPTWMWANWEIASLTEWLRTHNSRISSDKKVGFYGLDVYSLWDSLEVIIRYLDKEDPEGAQMARQAFWCFKSFGQQGKDYGRKSYNMKKGCEKELLQMLHNIRQKAPSYSSDSEASFNTEQNAIVALNAEKYYRAMFRIDQNSWNIRDIHMVDTLNRLMKHHGPNAKVIVWEHNTHVGDARATDMKDQGLVNVGQLVREQHSSDGVFIVGFGTYEGSVIAGAAWDAPMDVMRVPPAIKGSLEAILHEQFKEDKILIFGENHPYEYLNKTLLHRAIGVVYHPDREQYGNYVPTLTPERYDAFIYIDTTSALRPLHIEVNHHKEPETYPFGD